MSQVGHDIRVHRQNYRLPQDTLQTAKVPKILLLMEQEKVSSEYGKSLDDIEIDLEGGYPFVS